MDEYQNNNFSQGVNEPNSPAQPAYPPQPAGQPGPQGNYQQAYQERPSGAPGENYYYRQQPNAPYSGGPGNMPYNPYVQQMPEEISMWKYLGMMWVMALPIVGLVLMIIWAFSNEGINRRNYARAVLLNMVIAMALGIFLWGTMMAIMLQIMRMSQYVH